MANFVSKENLLRWLKELMIKKTLIAPVQDQQFTLFIPIKSVEEITLDYQFTPLSPKEYFFPPSEVIFSIKGEEIKSPQVERGFVLFGIRPCDAFAIHILDAPFLSPPPDTLYKERREVATLIGLACLQPRPECFCSSVGTNPVDPSYMDILLIPHQGGFIVDIRTEKGRGDLASASVEEIPLSPISPPALTQLPIAGIEQIAPLVFEHGYWQRLADRCIHCNICAYVCPCCYCFDLRDYSLGGEVERIRSWESCQSSWFTRLAGGYEPRPGKGARLRNRFYHKFLYFFEQFGLLGCSGCGRCVRACPVNIDIREVISDIVEIGGKVAQR